jgi:hypothetical protein
MILDVSVNFLFYSTQGLVHFAVIGFVVFAEFMNERNDHRETATDQSHHKRRIHRPISQLALAVELRTRHFQHPNRSRKDARRHIRSIDPVAWRSIRRQRRPRL